ncbi:MAG: hypothetical protein CEN88_162, partial [Candidatus Berkelbacteria bacterium Licking1014_2]
MSLTNEKAESLIENLQREDPELGIDREILIREASMSPREFKKWLKEHLNQEKEDLLDAIMANPCGLAEIVNNFQPPADLAAQIIAGHRHKIAS